MATCAGCQAELPPSKRKWCSERCRKSQYAGQCLNCGKATNGSDGRGKRASTRCQECATEHAKACALWTRERLIAEARRWHDLTGWWPTSTQWHTTCGSAPDEAYLAAVLEFRVLTGPWPSAAIVGRAFGSWAAFIAAAGGQSLGCPAGVKNGQRAAEMRAAIEALDNGPRP